MTMTTIDTARLNGDQSLQVQAKRMPPQVQDDGEFQNLMDSGRFEHLQRVAKMFSESQLIPEHFRGSLANCFIGLQMALRMKIDPLMLFQNSYVVHGKPGIEAKLAIALINSSGLFTDSLDYEIDGDDPSHPSFRVRAYAARKTTGKVVQGPWVDWKMVRAEKWDTNAKWKNMPGVMFQYRAAMFFARLHCPERLMGMQTVDELREMDGDQVVPAITERSAKALQTRLQNLQTARPLSEGQTLVDDNGEVIPTPTADSLMGTDAADEASADLERQVDNADAQPPSDIDPAEAIADLSLDEFKNCCRQQAPNMHRPDFEKMFTEHLTLKLGKAGPKFKTVTLAERKAMLAMFAAKAAE